MSENLQYERYKIDSIIQLIKESIFAAGKAHEILFKKYDSKTNELIAATYLNKAISLMSAARSIYVSNIEILERQEIESIFYKFSTFESEFLNNISTDHSHQWTDIEFQRFKESVEAFIDIKL